MKMATVFSWHPHLTVSAGRRSHWGAEAIFSTLKSGWPATWLALAHETLINVTSLKSACARGLAFLLLLNHSPWEQVQAALLNDERHVAHCSSCPNPSRLITREGPLHHLVTRQTTAWQQTHEVGTEIELAVLKLYWCFLRKWGKTIEQGSHQTITWQDC